MKTHVAALVTALLAAGTLSCEAPAPPTKLVHVGLAVDGFGKIVSAPTALSCAPACAGDFPVGTHLTLQARAQVGSVFSSWDGDCADAAGPVVDRVLDADLVCLAHFVDAPPPAPPVVHTLTVIALGPGRVTATPDGASGAGSGGAGSGGAGSGTGDGDGVDVELTCRDETCRGDFTEGTLVSLAAFADPGSDVVGFSGDCDALSATAGEVSMDADHVCTVSFFSQDDVTYPLRVLVAGGGRVTSSPGALECDASDADCVARFAGGTVVTLTATANDGAQFREWGQACAGLTTEPTLAVEVDFGIACSAVFDRSVELTVMGQGTISGTGIHCTSFCSVVAGDAVDVTATPDAGWRFSGWSGDCAGEDPTTSLSADAHACTATFAKIPPSISVAVEGDGTVTSADDVLEPALACPAAACEANVINHPALVDPAPTSWTCNNFFNGTHTGCNCGCGTVDPDCASASVSSCTFFTGCARDFVVEDQNNLCYVEPHGGVPTVTLTATPSAGSSFSSWSGACSGTDPVVSVPVPESVSCTATFTTP